MDGLKIFKLLADISFQSGLQNVVLSTLLLFSCACYQVDLDDIKQSELATFITCNFNISWPLYFYFSNVINLCPNFWFIINSKYQQFLFEKKTTRKTYLLKFLKECYFVMGQDINVNVGVFKNSFVGFLKSVVMYIFPKFRQSYVNLNVKSRPKFSCP